MTQSGFAENQGGAQKSKMGKKNAITSNERDEAKRLEDEK